MDEMQLLTDLRRDPPPITPGATLAARARLLAAATEAVAHATPRPAARRRWFPRQAGRVAAAGALVVAIAAAFTLAQAFNVDQAGTGRGRIGVLPAPAVASATELGALAAEAVQNDPAPQPTQWVYLKMFFVPSRTTEESWYRVDGERVATNYGGRLHLHDGGKFPRYGPKLPADPDKALAFLREEVTKRHSNEAAPIEAERRRKVLNSSQVNEMVFRKIGDILRIEPLAPEVQATLYRTLPKIPGVKVEPDVKDVTGRPGVAFALVNGSIRNEIILDARAFRYLGSQSVAIRDLPPQPIELPPGVSDKDGKGDTGFAGAKAGSVLDAAVTLAKSVVDQPGERG